MHIAQIKKGRKEGRAGRRGFKLDPEWQGGGRERERGRDRSLVLRSASFR